MKNKFNKKRRPQTAKASRKVQIVTPTLTKTIAPLRTKIRVAWTDNFSISTVAGSTAIRFDFGSDVYDLKKLASLTDYTENDNYVFMRLLGMTVDIVRWVDELTMVNAVHGSSIFIGYDPVLFGTSLNFNTLSRDVSAYKVDLMTFDKQHLVLPVYDLQYVTAIVTTIITLNNRKFMAYQLGNSIGGQVAIATDNSVNNAAAVKLFSVLFKFHVEFAYRK